MALLEIRNITRRFGKLEAVKDVTLDIEAGEFFTLLGPSGCGKTTILRMIAGFDAPDAGELYLDGQPLAGMPPEKRPVHTVFQSYALFPHLSVAGNIAFPHELSGGQRQRVALARGLVNKPRLLLLDEPLGALDAKLRERMQGELIALQREVGVTFVFVTHAQQEALALSHRIAVMNAGRIEQLDLPEALYCTPKSRFVADFIGTINLISAEVLEANRHGLRLDAAGLGEITAPPLTAAVTGARGTLAIRPEHLRISAHAEHIGLKNHFSGTIGEYLYRGDVTVYKVRLDNGLLLEALATNAGPGRARFHEIGDRVSIEWRHDAGIFLQN